MNISFNGTVSPSKRRTRSVVMTLAACALSLVNIFLEKIYSSAPKMLSSYDPLSLYLITFIVSVALLSSALTMLAQENKHLVWIVSLVSACLVGISYFMLSASPANILLALAFIPSSFITSVCISHGCEKSHTVVAGTVVVGIVFLLSILFSHYAAFGEISKLSITHTVNIIRDAFVAIYEELGYANLGISASQLHAAFDVTLLIIPSLFCAFAAVISYISVSIARLIILAQRANSEKLARWPLKMSRLSSLVFLISFLIAALSMSGESQVAVMSAINLMIVLLPGFFLIGIRTAFLHVKRPGFFGMILGIFILITCIQNPAMLFVLVSTLGAIDNLFSSFRARLYGENKNKRI